MWNKHSEIPVDTVTIQISEYSANTYICHIQIDLLTMIIHSIQWVLEYQKPNIAYYNISYYNMAIFALSCQTLFS